MSQTFSKKQGVSAQPSIEPPATRSPAPPVEQKIDPGLPSTGSAAESASVEDEAIRTLAYQRWEAAGRPDGSDVDFWLQAERELR